MNKILILVIGVFIFTNLVYAESPQAQTYDCSEEINPLLINLSILNQTVNNLSGDLDYYKNLATYYKNLYENTEINVTNKELIILHQQVNNMNIEINDIKHELSFLKLTLKISIPIISVTFFSLLGFTIYLRRKIRGRKHE